MGLGVPVEPEIVQVLLGCGDGLEILDHVVDRKHPKTETLGFEGRRHLELRRHEGMGRLGVTGRKQAHGEHSGE